MFIIRKLLVKEQNWPLKKNNILKIERLAEVIHCVYMLIINQLMLQSLFNKWYLVFVI